MRIGIWCKGVDTVEVDHEIVALMVRHAEWTELLEFDPVKNMTTGKNFGPVTMDDVETRYGKLEENKGNAVKQFRKTNKKVMFKQTELF